jgi:hypothetical protein
MAQGERRELRPGRSSCRRPDFDQLVRTWAGVADLCQGVLEVVGEGSAAVMACGPAWMVMVR